jgi:hypothetical protein
VEKCFEEILWKKVKKKLLSKEDFQEILLKQLEKKEEQKVFEEESCRGSLLPVVNLYRSCVRLGSCRGSLPPVVNFYRSCVGLRWLAQETTGFILVRASEE